MRSSPSPSFRRVAGNKSLAPVLVAVCEGATETKLLNDLKQRWRLHSLRVIAIGQVGPPGKVVARARAERTKHDDAETWAVFDHDEHQCWSSALVVARKNSIQVAASNPCVELWGLLLHRDHTAHIERGDAQRLLASVHPNYNHEKHPYFKPDVVVELLRAAEQRADQIGARAESNGDPFGNPSTTFHRLLQRMSSSGFKAGT